MNIEIRTIALKKLERIAKKEKDFSYRRICDYAFAYQLPLDDRIWLYKRLKEKGIRILGTDPTAEPEERPRKFWFDEDGSEFLDRAHNDYEAVYVEITKMCEALGPLVEKARSVKPPQWGEGLELESRIRKGDKSARDRLLEMYLRTALAIGLKWSKTLDVDLQDAVGDACEELVKSVNRYDPDRHGIFPTYCVHNIYYTVLHRHAIHNWPMVKTCRTAYATTYSLLKKEGCLQCDRLVHCDTAVMELAEKLNRDTEECRMLIQTAVSPLSLETNPKINGYDGQTEDVLSEEDDGPEYETEMPDYCVDTVDEAETGVRDSMLRQKLEESLSVLSLQEKEVLALSNGLFGKRKHSLKEIGYRYGVSRQRVFQIETNAMDKLRTKGARLKEYL